MHPILRIINDYKLNRKQLCLLSGLNYLTMRYKFVQKPNYTLTDSDINALTAVLKDLARDINDNL